MDDRFVEMPCLYCSKPVTVEKGSPEHQGIFNVYCEDNDGLCEDKHAFLEKTGEHPTFVHELRK